MSGVYFPPPNLEVKSSCKQNLTLCLFDQVEFRRHAWHGCYKTLDVVLVGIVCLGAAGVALDHILALVHVQDLNRTDQNSTEQQRHDWCACARNHKGSIPVEDTCEGEEIHARIILFHTPANFMYYIQEHNSKITKRKPDKI